MLVHAPGRRRSGVRRPPELPFAAFGSVLASLAADGVPQRIDSSVINQFRLGVSGEVVPSLQFLGLADETRAPTPRLNELVAAYQTERWRTVFRSVLESAYEPLFQMPLESVTAGELHEGFRRAYPEAGADGLRKAMAFFLKAATEADVPVSRRVVRRTRRAVPEARPGASTTREAAQVLADLLDPQGMTLEEQSAVATLLRYLKRR